MPATALARSILTGVPAPVLAVFAVLVAAVIVAVSILAAHGVAVHHGAMVYDHITNKMSYGGQKMSYG